MSSASYAPIPSTDDDYPLPPTINDSLLPDRIVMQRRGRPSYKSVILLHFVFKVSAFILYILGSLIMSSYIAVFIFVTMLHSMDFWVVKNVSGRLMAGLRWWSVVDDNGDLTWRYEKWSEEERELARPRDANLFWAGLVVNLNLWITLSIISVFRLNLSWFILCCIAITLNSANTIGYLRCRLGQMLLLVVIVSQILSKYMPITTTCLLTYVLFFVVIAASNGAFRQEI